MSSKPKLFAVAAVLVMLLATVGPVAAFAGDDTAGNDSMSTAGNDAPLAIHVSETEDDATVTVTDGTEPVADATVNVTSLGDASYAGEGSYTTDENGTVTLATPDEAVEVELVATANGENATVTTVLGDWEPTYDDDAPFGQHVSRFVHHLLDRDDLDDDKPFGQMVREFVHDQKDKANDRAAKHDQADSTDDRDDKSDRADRDDDRSDKRADNARDNEDKRPDHAGPKDKQDKGADDSDEDDEETEESD
ncbi:hypothetical protein [Haladaptatus sp. CMSO5]|uniref:hypothetical protein n=1 Tax=Haladaptatus sp. CMSO5 TaxID=3120514 RepID=UPI002FCE62F0